MCIGLDRPNQINACLIVTMVWKDRPNQINACLIVTMVWTHTHTLETHSALYTELHEII